MLYENEVIAKSKVDFIGGIGDGGSSFYKDLPIIIKDNNEGISFKLDSSTMNTFTGEYSVITIKLLIDF